MRWKARVKPEKPKYGEKRYVRLFAWRPLKIGFEWVWLERFFEEHVYSRPSADYDGWYGGGWEWTTRWTREAAPPYIKAMFETGDVVYVKRTVEGTLVPPGPDSVGEILVPDIDLSADLSKNTFHHRV